MTRPIERPAALLLGLLIDAARARGIVTLQADIPSGGELDGVFRPAGFDATGLFTHKAV